MSAFVFRMLAALWLVVLAAPIHAATVEYIHTDALGSPVAVTNSAGQVIERREYEPYGRQLAPVLSNGPGYTGHVADAATGLNYMQQRYYDPGIGRFLSVDPVTANSGANFNRYTYAGNNPYAFLDPDGRSKVRKERGSLNDHTSNQGGVKVAYEASHVNRTGTSRRTSDSGTSKTLDQTAQEVVTKRAGPDGVVNLDYESEFLKVFEAEIHRISVRSKSVGGYENLSDADFYYEEAYRRGDSMFYGPQAGGRLYRINGAPASLGSGPYFGGNLNYVNQGLIFAAGGRSLNDARGMIQIWNKYGHSSSQYLDERLKFAEFGYRMWSAPP